MLAINGDYDGFRDTGIVIRNGVAYRDQGARQGWAIRTDGSMSLYDETKTNAAELLADRVWQTLSFGPGLVENGEVIAGIDNPRSTPTSATTRCRATSRAPAWA